MRGGSVGLAAVLADPSLPPRSKGHRWADLRARTLSALVLAPLAIGAMWVGGGFFEALVAAAALVLGAEWLAMCRAGRCPVTWLGGGFAIVALWAAALAWLRADPAAGRVNVIGLAAIVWASDVGAYLTGRLAGGPRLAPRISPGKTWSGGIGGLVLAGLTAWVLARLTTGAHAGLAILIGSVASALGQAGDLAESAAKRRCGVKDSGRLIPGHGGLLDRLDATLAVAPAAALLSLILGRGVVLWQ
jgi:phosphatidate cytidylyltransferase